MTNTRKPSRLKAAPSSKRKTTKRTKTRASQQTYDNSNYYWFIGVIYVMILFGMIMILSASSVRAYASTGDSYYYIKKQLVSLGLGTLALIFMYRFPIKSLQKIAPMTMAISIGLLVAVLIPGIGREVDGASRWIPIGSFRLQPSELVKVAVVLYTADFIYRNKGKIQDIGELIYPYGTVIVLIVALVMKQPDMGTTVSICVTALAMILVGGIGFRYILGVTTVGGIAGTFLIYSAAYRLKRFAAFLNPAADPLGAGYHIRQSLIAFGSGGLLGIGLGMSRQKYFYLPAAHTDFIFAIIGEELGLLGTLFTVGLFIAFAYYGIMIARNSNNRFAQLVGSGVTAMIVLQAIINMGAVTAILPVTGIPMPFISYGGSSLIVNLASIGILLRIATESKRHKNYRHLSVAESEIIHPRVSASAKAKLYLIDGDEEPYSTTSHRSTRSTKSSTSPKSRSRSSAKSRSTSSRITNMEKERTRRPKTNASDDKRRRDSRSRVSGTSTRQSSTRKNRKH